MAKPKIVKHPFAKYVLVGLVILALIAILLAYLDETKIGRLIEHEIGVFLTRIITSFN
jgi:drug/metabolite transporter superfamily protein YnfA